MQNIRIVCLALLLTSCATTAPVKPVNVLEGFPVKPELVTYTKPPVVKRIGTDYQVTPELITNATLLTDYYKRLETWKQLKSLNQ